MITLYHMIIDLEGCSYRVDIPDTISDLEGAKIFADSLWAKYADSGCGGIILVLAKDGKVKTLAYDDQWVPLRPIPDAYPYAPSWPDLAQGPGF